MAQEASPSTAQEAAPTQSPALATYADRPDVRSFVDEMVVKHGFEKEALLALFRQAQTEPAVLAAIRPPDHPSARSWRGYRKQFVEKRHIKAGRRFMDEHRLALQAASDRFGVPPSIIAAIIGVETFYGRVQGRFNTFSALTTLAFDYPPRADLFRRELGEFLLLARENQRDPLSYTGSYAGALGMPQFLPSSLRHYAVDGDGDGRIDLSGNVADAIGSVASFLSLHGWEKGGSVAQPARVKGEAYQELVDGNVDPLLSPAVLRAHGIAPPRHIAADQKLALIDLATPRKPTEYWLGSKNFYVITRYNKSSFYAMAVYQLAERLRQPTPTKVKISPQKPAPHSIRGREGAKGRKEEMQAGK
ncbi:MAG: lytic murein transglycosylase B [Rhodocyclaceae bacterium]|nr:lytic murein transglycosylase B [Rhodocyclaceae bacterium]